jgi:hypothetical protein
MADLRGRRGVVVQLHFVSSQLDVDVAMEAGASEM